MKLVVIAFVLAVPVSIYLMNRWLDGFAYRIDIDMVMYLTAGGIALLIALLTVSFESIRAVSGNPVKALRNK